MTGSMSRTEGRLHDDAYKRFDRRLSDWIAIGVIISVALHYAFFTLFPSLRAAEISGGGEGITAIQLPPTVEVPPPPVHIVRPATPRVGAAEVAEDLTIAPTTFEANPVENLPPPPRTEAPSRSEEDRPRFIPYDTPPRLLNGEEIQRILQREYPRDLREARVEGRVILWAYVDEEGEVRQVRVQQSSGYAAMDQVALAVAQRMEYRPARNRDKKTAVWVQQAIAFVMQ
jgi:protein TonB